MWLVMNVNIFASDMFILAASYCPSASSHFIPLSCSLFVLPFLYSLYLFFLCLLFVILCTELLSDVWIKHSGRVGKWKRCGLKEPAAQEGRKQQSRYDSFKFGIWKIQSNVHRGIQMLVIMWYYTATVNNPMCYCRIVNSKLF